MRDPSGGGTLRFSVFEIDTRSGELRKRGVRVPLQQQPFRILTRLVERPGEIVTREAIRQELWPADTYVDFEQGINAAVKRLREALGDSAETPLFVETLPKRGYRFIAPINSSSPATPIPDQRLDAEAASADAGMGEAILGRSAAEPLVAPRTHPTRRAGYGLAALAVALGGIAFGLSHVGCPPWHTNTEARVVPVTSFPGSESHAAFSPDGNQIAFVWDGAQEDNPDIYVKFVDSAEPLRLTTNPAPDFNPVWSPDGRHIAFTREGEASGIYLVPALGGPEHKLTDIWSENPFRLRLSYSPEGKYLAVADKRSAAEPSSIFLLEIETGEQRQLTRPPRGSVGDESPSFSPDGKSLAFARLLGGTKHIYVVPTEGGEPSRVNIDNQDRGSFTDGLAWTSDGREIVFSSNREGSFHLWRVPVGGGAPTRVEVFAQGLTHPAISRRGDRLAWTHTSLDTNIWRVEMGDAEGPKAPRVQLITSTMGDSSPQFSDDGRIVFTSSRTGRTEIWVADREGKSPVRLTHTNGPNIGTPRWSPDGRQIAFDAILAGNRDIYVINSTGGKPRPVTTEQSEECCPSWSRDGRWIYFGSERSGTLQIWKVPSTGGPAVPVTRQGGFEGFEVESSEGRHFYYAKGRDIPGIWRIAVGGGEETPVLDHHGAGYWRSWAVTEQGIYFATAETPNRPILEFFSFATHQVTPVTTIDKPIPRRSQGLSVSPDRRWIIYTQIDHQNSDIMLMENFR
jgi:Tol biopolymer transport system component/DNA-binding winged helix-turn-helix (wHTH) protein